MRSKKTWFQKKGVVALLRVDRNVLTGNPGLFQRSDQLLLLFRIKANIRIDAEDQEVLIPAPVEESQQTPGTRVSDQVEILPEIHNSKVGIGIEPFYEFSSLVEHV